MCRPLFRTSRSPRRLLTSCLRLLSMGSGDHRKVLQQATGKQDNDESGWKSHAGRLLPRSNFARGLKQRPHCISQVTRLRCGLQDMGSAVHQRGRSSPCKPSRHTTLGVCRDFGVVKRFPLRAWGRWFEKPASAAISAVESECKNGTAKKFAVLAGFPHHFLCF